MDPCTSMCSLCRTLSLDGTFIGQHVLNNLLPVAGEEDIYIINQKKLCSSFVNSNRLKARQILDNNYNLMCLFITQSNVKIEQCAAWLGRLGKTKQYVSYILHVPVHFRTWRTDTTPHFLFPLHLHTFHQ